LIFLIFFLNNNLSQLIKPNPSEQLKTKHNLPTDLARSFTVSVLPVPAGPAGAPPRFNFNAPVNVK